MAEELLKAKEAQEMLKVSKSTFYKLVKQKKLSRTELSPRCTRFYKDQIQFYIDKHKVTAS